MFFVIVDAYSKWPEIIEMTSNISAATIRQLTRLFAQFSNLTTLVSHNGSQFASKEFAEFRNTNGITHTYRRTPYSASKDGRSPAENFLGRRLRPPLTILTMPKSVVKERNRKMERQFNLYNNGRPKKFELDDRVWVRKWDEVDTWSCFISTWPRDV
ncbi:hypothetical protein ANCDUO_06646 [Ancylostoma duodenale]|uniref:Integrase catalytic domain-containing protein n=1 Tax=Ancylostoma duodenale TaxID=51022 RepID=A0A0C2DKI7_9BILA|nr:hypothetical protein ANCDUO_06646 [Ancylostoma duodenale]